MPPNQKHMGPAHKAVLDLLTQQGADGVSDAEGAAVLRMARTGYAQRRAWLLDRGYVRPARDPEGNLVRRPGSNHRDGCVWLAVKGGPPCSKR